jgi:peptidoglycan/xylan/chitin deacetylase (PgdA/CDA1 family)
MESQAAQDLLARLQRDHRVRDTRDGLLRSSFIRTINYHSTAAPDRALFEKQLAYLSQNFVSVSVDDVDRFLETGAWHKEKPGLILAIFEGFRNHYDVFYPLLEKYGITGWFHIPAFFPDVPAADQVQFSREHRLHITHPEEYSDQRYAMNWDEIREISQHHILCCHSGSHFQIKLDTPDGDMQREIVEAKQHIEAKTGRECPVFCWLFGEEYAYNPRAAAFIQRAGYRYVVGNLKMERVGKPAGGGEHDRT